MLLLRSMLKKKKKKIVLGLLTFAFTFSAMSIFQAIVRGSKIGVDGSLTWLLDEFETMSVIRSNSLRRGSPPTQPRRDSGSSGTQENGEHPHQHHEHAGKSRDR